MHAITFVGETEKYLASCTSFIARLERKSHLFVSLSSFSLLMEHLQIPSIWLFLGCVNSSQLGRGITQPRESLLEGL